MPTLHRRAVLLGGAASAVLAPIAHAISLPPIVPPAVAASPFLPVVDDTGLLFRMHQAPTDDTPMPGGRTLQFMPGAIVQIHKLSEHSDDENPSVTLPRWKLALIPVDARSGIPVASVAEAEDRLLAMLPAPVINYPHEISRPRDVVDWKASFPILLCCAASRIAVHSRRGAGNIVLVPPAGLRLLEQVGTTAFACASQDPPRRMGRWRFAGKLIGSMDVWVGAHLPPDRAYVVFAPEAAYGHAVLIRTPTGLALATESADPMSARGTGAAADFFSSVGIRAA